MGARLQDAKFFVVWFFVCFHR